ncbi:MAG: substrate-binding domain-containing protein [Oscillospiraceae bacterium]|nr:substrate-binding domain-containing protein [Oscillospiraceae bacterium]
MFTQAQALGYDLLLFTGVYNIHTDRDYNAYHRGLDNIYALPAIADLDAVILAGDRFKSEEIIRAVDAQLAGRSIPKLVLNHPMQGYINVYPEQAEYVYCIVKHLIEVHGCRNIYCMAGIQGEVATIELLAGFRRAMHEAGLPCPEEIIFYENFYEEYPLRFGRDIAAGKVERPDAVVCQSDNMAAALITGLQEGGLSVPEDIAVTGYDGSWVSSFTKPSVTTVIGRDSELGRLAVTRVHQLLTGQHTEIPRDIQKLSIRRSCGCRTIANTVSAADPFFMKFSQNMVLQYYSRKSHISADFMTLMTTADSIETLVSLIRDNTDMISSAADIDICLCEDWKMDFADAEHYRRADYSDTMLSVLSQDVPVQFPTRHLVPRLMLPHEPTLTVFTSLFCKDQILGYTAVSFRQASDVCIDEYYMNWTDAIANGLRTVQEKLYRDYVQRELALHTTHDPNTGLLNKKGLLEQAEHFTADGKRVCVLLSYREPDSTAAGAGFAPAQLIANAIRLTSDKRELYARLEERIFCILLQAPEDNAAEERILSIERELRYMQGSMKNLFRCEIVYEKTVLEGCDSMDLETVLIGQMQRLTARVGGKATANTVREQLYSLRHTIHLEPERDWHIKETASRLGFSESYLQHLYRTEFSVSLTNDVIHARVEKAKRLLTKTDLLISEVAELCGYQSLRHFTRQFGQYTGITPTDYRKKHS